MKRKRLRVPAGVVIRGKARGGRFVSVEQLATLANQALSDEAASLAKLLRLAHHEEARAARAHQRAADRYVETELVTDRRRVNDARRVQDDMARTVNRIEIEALRYPSKDVRRFPKLKEAQAKQLGRGMEDEPIDPRDLEDFEPEDAAPEWELGLEYGAATRGHDVDVNVRVARADGSPMTESEARDAFTGLRASGEVPPQYVVNGVRWRRGGKSRWREYGDPYMNLANLLNPVQQGEAMGGPEPIGVRLGAVKVEPEERLHARCGARLKSPLTRWRRVRCLHEEGHGGTHYAKLWRNRYVEWTDDGEATVI